MKYYLWTIGCQMNQADSWRAADQLQACGWELATSAEEADLVILNTCVVRQSAEDKVYGRLNSLKNLKVRSPQASLVVMGCLVGDDSEPLDQRFPFVDLFLRPSEVEDLLSFAQTKQVRAALEPTGSRQETPVSCYVPVMEGCDHHCTYCIVRLRRGRERSRPIEQIVEDVGSLVARGAREITLLGQNVNAYGHDLPGDPDLADLLRAVHDLEGLLRIRFLTSHPGDMTNRVIDAVADLEKVCEHIELPIQAGHDVTLKRMARGYTVRQYRHLLRSLRDRVPHVSVATDIIVGFPGETEEHFQATYDFLAEERFDVVHVACYSPRVGTPAAHLEDDVPLAEKERRRRMVEDLQEQVAGEINRRLLGSKLEVLVEEEQRGKWRGRTRSNKLVFFPSELDWRGYLAPVKITWTGPWSMQGEVTAPRPDQPLD